MGSFHANSHHLINHISALPVDNIYIAYDVRSYVKENPLYPDPQGGVGGLRERSLGLEAAGGGARERVPHPLGDRPVGRRPGQDLSRGAGPRGRRGLERERCRISITRVSRG